MGKFFTTIPFLSCLHSFSFYFCLTFISTVTQSGQEKQACMWWYYRSVSGFPLNPFLHLMSISVWTYLQDHVFLKGPKRFSCLFHMRRRKKYKGIQVEQRIKENLIREFFPYTTCIHFFHFNNFKLKHFHGTKTFFFRHSEANQRSPIIFSIETVRLYRRACVADVAK